MVRSSTDQAIGEDGYIIFEDIDAITIVFGSQLELTLHCRVVKLNAIDAMNLISRRC